MSKELTPMEELIEWMNSKESHCTIYDIGRAEKFLQLEKIFTRKKEREAASNGFLNGFKASAEGYNGEYPFEGCTNEFILADIKPKIDKYLDKKYPL
jgi:hypothetical protein